LQPQKTRILEKEKFLEVYLSTPLDKELNSLYDKFKDLIEQLGLEDRYEPINYDDLTPDQQEIVDALNLVQLFKAEFNLDKEPEIPLLKFILRRLGQLGDDSIVDEIIDKIESLHPILPDIIGYFSRLRFLSEEGRHKIGNKVIELMKSSIISELPYHKMWSLDLFTKSKEWDSEGEFLSLYSRETDLACQRKLILAMGRAGQKEWFQSQWRKLLEHTPWPRRALVAGASCMPIDARRHWYKEIKSQLDLLEYSVMKWAMNNPF